MPFQLMRLRRLDRREIEQQTDQAIRDISANNASYYQILFIAGVYQLSGRLDDSVKLYREAVAKFHDLSNDKNALGLIESLVDCAKSCIKFGRPELAHMICREFLPQVGIPVNEMIYPLFFVIRFELGRVHKQLRHFGSGGSPPRVGA